MKKVLLLCASHNDLGSIRALRKLGYYIIVTGNRENLSGQKWVDKYIKADYSDKDLILEIARKEEIDNICACCNDFGVYTAAYVAEKMGLPGYDGYDTTLVLNNKDKFKGFALENGIITPYSEGFSSIDEALEVVSDRELPFIVKPVDCSAGNGISVVESREDAKKAIEYAFNTSRVGRIVIEQFIEGTQHGFCSFIRNRKVVAFCTNDEYSIINKFRVEIDTFPATDWSKYSYIIIEQIELIAEKLSLADGIFHLQYMVCNGKPWILEVMRRTIGNMYHVLGNQINGINWEYWEMRARCGLGCDKFPTNVEQEGYFAYKTILAEQNGMIEEVTVPEEYQKYIFDSHLLLNKGDYISDYKNQPVGFLFMMFSDENEMKSVLIDNYHNGMVKID